MEFAEGTVEEELDGIRAELRELLGNVARSLVSDEEEQAAPWKGDICRVLSKIPYPDINNVPFDHYLKNEPFNEDF
jgi:hypothetical protein